MADGLTGEQAVDRLIRRGGQIVVFRREYGLCMVVTLVERTPEGEMVTVEEREVASGGQPSRTGDARHAACSGRTRITPHWRGISNVSATPRTSAWTVSSTAS